MVKTIEIELFLAEAVSKLDHPLNDEVLRFAASSLLVPREYEFVRARGCLHCGSVDMENLKQGAFGRQTDDPHEWPYSCPAGDMLLFQCKMCGNFSEFVFRFRL